MEREKERELELEGAMYTNCLLLGLDPSIIGVVGGGNSTTPRVGLFRHSNPKLGEQLLYFLLSSLRGPIQSARDFDRVWPIFDSAQSRDFRKVVQAIINELESQGALPRSNSRVSSLATCCGPRFIELLWQLSLHALREVHRRTFVSDVASTPLPAPLTDVAFSHAATLLPVTKARIALERRRFLKNADIAVQRQAMWSNLAHEMTAEFRGLCAEEAYLQQELEKLQDLRNKAKLDGELWDARVSSSSSQNSHLISKATRLWESLLARKGQHEVLASGPIEDLINHREHRYRISGSSLLAAIDQSSQVPYRDVLSIEPGDTDSASAEDKEPMDLLPGNANRQKTYLHSAQAQNDDSWVEDRSGRVHPTVDIAEILRRWTHALQRIHKQSLHMAKANGGEGPELLQSAHEGGSSGHAESLASTLTEHRQHLASIQVLINQLKEAAPALQTSISELTEEVNSISSTLPPLTNYQGRSTSSFQAQSSGRTLENSLDDVSEVSSKLSSVKLQKVSASPPALKLPQLFSLTPNSSGKSSNAAKRHTFASQTNEVDNISEGKQLNKPQSNGRIDNPSRDGKANEVQNLRRSVREAALSVQSCNMESLRDNQSDDGSEHFFVPLSVTGFSYNGPETKLVSGKSKQQYISPSKTSLLKSTASDGYVMGKYDEKPSTLTNGTVHDIDSQVNGFQSATGSQYPAFDQHKSVYDTGEALDQVFSPPLLMDTSLLEDPFEDLLAPLSEIDAALMEH